MAAVIANRGGFYSAGAYVEEARRMGILILGPDVNLSAKECMAVDCEDSEADTSKVYMANSVLRQDLQTLYRAE